MMNNIEALRKSFEELRLRVPAEDFADFAMENDFSEEIIEAITQTFEMLVQKKQEMSIEFLLKCSRLPLKNPRTFANFKFDDVKGRDVERLKSIQSLAPMYSHKNLAFIGPAGTGKTHLAMAFGYECCQKMMKAYFIKMTELNDLFTEARKYDRVSRVMTRLMKPSCLIIDEVLESKSVNDYSSLFNHLVPILESLALKCDLVSSDTVSIIDCMVSEFNPYFSNSFQSI